MLLRHNPRHSVEAKTTCRVTEGVLRHKPRHSVEAQGYFHGRSVHNVLSL